MSGEPFFQYDPSNPYDLVKYVKIWEKHLSQNGHCFNPDMVRTNLKKYREEIAKYHYFKIGDTLYWAEKEVSVIEDVYSLEIN